MAEAIPTMEQKIRSFPRENGELQRVQCVRLPDWSALDFFVPAPSPDALSRFTGIYRDYLVPACPWIFGSMVLFTLPEKVSEALPLPQAEAGAPCDPLLRASAVLRKGLRIRKGKPTYSTPEAKALYEALLQENAVEIAAGKLPFTKIIPVNNLPGYLSRSTENARLLVNSPFFVMDCFDCASPYDTVGTPFGLAVKNGIVYRPPLFGREALIIKRDGAVSVEYPELRSLGIRINGREYRPGENCRVFSRPQCRKTPAGSGTDLVIIGREVIAMNKGGGTPVPASGFVLRIEAEGTVYPGSAVEYSGMEDIALALQIGSSTVKAGVKSTGFESPYYNIYRPWTTEFPPSLYPLDYKTARAARIVLGADTAGRPMLLWAEGAAKVGHVPGVDSCGASLSELADICLAFGMVNGVNLDGGGSAQLLIDGKRALRISDRAPDGSERERPIPEGLVVR